MGDIAGEQPHGWRQVDRCTFAMHLRVQDVHHSDVVTGFDETARERGPNESCPASDEHGFQQSTVGECAVGQRPHYR